MKKLITLILLASISIHVCNAQLPSVTLKNIEGKTINTAKLENRGKPFIISFFALWCKPCLRELKAINEVYADWQEETGVKLIAVSIDQAQDASKVLPAVNGYGWDYEVLLDPNSDFKRAMNVSLIPTVFVCDGNGKVISQRTSYTDGSESHLIETVREILKKETEEKN